MLDHTVAFEKLTTITDKYVEKAIYDDDERLNVILKPEKNFKKSELYESFLNLILISIRLKDKVQKMEGANELRKDVEMDHNPPWTEEIHKTVKNASEKIETQLGYYMTSIDKKISKLLSNHQVIESHPNFCEEALLIKDKNIRPILLHQF